MSTQAHRQNPVRVLHAIPDINPDYGGPVAILRNLLPELARLDVHCELVTTCGQLGSRQTPDTRFDSQLMATVHRFPRRNPLGWHYGVGLQAWLRGNIARFDLAHFRSLYNYPTLALSRAARAANIPRLLETEGSITPWSRAFKRYKKVPYLHLVERYNALRAEAFLVTHDSEAAALRALLPRHHGRVIELAPPVQCPGSAAPSRDYEPENILFLSRLHPKKGLELLFDAYATVARQCGKLQIAGSGDAQYVAGLKQHSARLGLADHIEFSGHLSGAEKQRALASARLFVLPSWDENFGVAAVEAVANGVPVIASDAVASAHDLAQDGYAQLFAAGNQQALADLLVQAWRDETWQQHVAGKGPAYAHALYAPQAHAARLASEYTRIIRDHA